jgi:hypothetical protein
MSINLEARQFVEDFTLTTPEGPKVFDSFHTLYTTLEASVEDRGYFIADLRSRIRDYDFLPEESRVSYILSNLPRNSGFGVCTKTIRNIREVTGER